MSTFKTSRVAIESGGSGFEAEERAMVRALIHTVDFLTADFPEVRDVVFYLPTKESMEHKALQALLKPALCKRLLANRSVGFKGELSLRLETRRTLSRGPSPDAILALLAGERDLNEIDECQGVSVVVAVPFSESAFGAWVEKWEPQIINSAGQTADCEPARIDPEVKRAFDAVTATTNLANAHLPERVKGPLESIFWQLKDMGREFSPSDVRREFLKRGWNPKATERAVKVAEQILKRKSRPKSADTYYPDGW